MKKIFIYGLALVLLTGGSLSLSSCIDETEPTSSFTEDQAHGSEKAIEALLWGMPAVLNSQGVYNSDYHFDFGYGALMHVRDRMTADVTRPYAGGYDWFSSWAYNEGQGPSMAICQFTWNTYWKFVQATNEMIKVLPTDLSTASDEMKGYAGAALAYRAMLYLDLARMYEFLPSKVDKNASGANFQTGVNSDGNCVMNLTVPIVDENATEESIKNNPRASRDSMAMFILNDLDTAEVYIPNLSITSHVMPHLDCVYGLKARLYMWLEQYDKAAQYAQLAINAATADKLTVMSENDCLSKTTGFNDVSKWMWGNQLVKENDAVQTSIINWASWMCNEASFGYANAGARLQIDASMYDRIYEDDFRKKLWSPGSMDEEASWYQNYCIDLNDEDVYYSNWDSYESIKFRPNQGNMDDYEVGAATAYPLMRVEEMWFIYMEAIAHSDAATGKSLLEKFMQTYRGADSYTCKATSQEGIIEEIVFQKRVELWGEGQTFFDIKRLDYSVTRGYEGTNFPDAACFNTQGRPSWMSFCIVQTEQNSNAALVGWNNPDPTDTYNKWTGE